MGAGVVTTGWSGTRVLVTGHTGFKGAWLSLWLHRLGAEVIGLSNGVPTVPSLYRDADVASLLFAEHTVDVRDRAAVAEAVRASAPQAVFHLAAQALVRASYADPVATWDTNVLGTVNVLDAIGRQPEVEAVVIVTSDKCYENRGDGRAYREGDALGGKDPYSASKAGAELVTASWRASFGDGSAPIASVRAGNVIGGGDWSPDRLVPDLIRAATSGTPLHLRNPRAVRPWQDVLDCLHGYLLVGEQLLAGAPVARAWNFGPAADEACDVEHLVLRLQELWPDPVEWVFDQGPHPPEAPLLLLDATDAREQLGWGPRRSLDSALANLVGWYAGVAAGGDARRLADAQLIDYEQEGP